MRPLVLGGTCSFLGDRTSAGILDPVSFFLNSYTDSNTVGITDTFQDLAFKIVKDSFDY